MSTVHRGTYELHKALPTLQYCTCNEVHRRCGPRKHAEISAHTCSARTDRSAVFPNGTTPRSLHKLDYVYSVKAANMEINPFSFPDCLRERKPLVTDGDTECTNRQWPIRDPLNGARLLIWKNNHKYFNNSRKIFMILMLHVVKTDHIHSACSRIQSAPPPPISQNWLLGPVLFEHLFLSDVLSRKQNTKCYWKIGVSVHNVDSGRQPFGPHGPLNSQFWIPRTSNMIFLKKVQTSIK
jgi:hypothetical protein